MRWSETQCKQLFTLLTGAEEGVQDFWVKI